MDFDYAQAFGKSLATGYERLLLDAMLGDQTLFSHRDGVELTGRSIRPSCRRGRRRTLKFFPIILRELGTGLLGTAAGARRAQWKNKLGKPE